MIKSYKEREDSMLKLPVCPYCHAVYHYKTVQKTVKQKEITCHNCKKTFLISYKKGRFLLLLFVAVFLVGFNLFLLNILKNITIWGCLTVTVVFVLIAMLLFPYTVRYKKKAESAKKEKKNNKRA